MKNGFNYKCTADSHRAGGNFVIETKKNNLRFRVGQDLFDPQIVRQTSTSLHVRICIAVQLMI
jgi:hypothetical protein